MAVLVFPVPVAIARRIVAFAFFNEPLRLFELPFLIISEVKIIKGLFFEFLGGSFYILLEEVRRCPEGYTMPVMVSDGSLNVDRQEAIFLTCAQAVSDKADHWSKKGRHPIIAPRSAEKTLFSFNLYVRGISFCL